MYRVGDAVMITADAFMNAGIDEAYEDLIGCVVVVDRVEVEAVPELATLEFTWRDGLFWVYAEDVK